MRREHIQQSNLVLLDDPDLTVLGSTQTNSFTKPKPSSSFLGSGERMDIGPSALPLTPSTPLPPASSVSFSPAWNPSSRTLNSLSVFPYNPWMESPFLAGKRIKVQFKDTKAVLRDPGWSHGDYEDYARSALDAPGSGEIRPTRGVTLQADVNWRMHFAKKGSVEGALAELDALPSDASQKLPETRRSRPIRFRAETRVCYTRPSNARSLRSPAQSRFEMSEFGDMSQRPFSPFLTTEERLANMEATISALSASNTSNSASMDRLSALFEKFMSGTPPNPTPAAPEADTTPPTPETTTPLPGSPRSGSHHLRPSPPPIYDGARSGGRAFLNACKLYFSLCGGSFADDHARIVWVLSYMQHGRAADFVSRVFQFGTAKDVFPAWKDFEDTFRGEFFLFDEVADAALILESTAYFQNGRSIDEYIDSFRSLSRGDSEASPRVARTTRRLRSGAHSQDFIMRSEDDFHRRMVPTKAPDSRQPTAAAARWAFATAPAPAPALAPPAPHAPVAPAPRPIPQGIPMDVDRMRDRVAPADDHCFRCKKKGHYSRDCPLHWDVRHMLDDELEALIMEHLARKDAVPADPTPSSADATASDAEEGF
ncbi:hypothetical protein D9615_009865 [Tricholomella constricta]|uniref:CCHC-type domain-containing protein n=1 Tax=Tricholomella constricta TaxID=117010 RepID=A0A8H5GX97_9AGAR|nr:hypothetical protein D9615_009865 [Tricholomella constricta]